MTEQRGRSWNAITVCVVAAVALAACGFAPVVRSELRARLPDIDRLSCPSRSFTPRRPPSLATLGLLAASEATPLRGHTFDAGHTDAGPQRPIQIGVTDRDIFTLQVRAAARAACSLRTVQDAQRAGYVLSSYNTQGVGVHWTNWRLVDRPFDPARPSMLLYGATGDGKLRLVGFSYWVRSEAPPHGFAGSADQWHRHFGLCFDRFGLLETEGLRSSRRCVGSWINGTDLWMLHAWIVPGHANLWGLFAPLNPELCRRNVADVIRCQGVG